MGVEYDWGDVIRSPLLDRVSVFSHHLQCTLHSFLVDPAVVGDGAGGCMSFRHNIFCFQMSDKDTLNICRPAFSNALAIPPL